MIGRPDAVPARDRIVTVFVFLLILLVAAPPGETVAWPTPYVWGVLLITGVVATAGSYQAVTTLLQADPFAK